MRNHWKILFNGFAAFALLAISTIPCASAAPKKTEDSDVGRIEELDKMDFIEMLNSVDVKNASELIQKFQTKEGKTRLLNGKYNPKGECTVEAYRNKEVLLVTIPAHLLFAPNMTELRKEAADYLAPIRRYLKDPDMYRVMLVMHTDNTGSEAYREQLTTDRVNAVFDWFEGSGADTRYLFSYSLADDMPLRQNDSMDNRDKNRRLEIYLLPGKKMVEQAQKGRIAF
ncbi:MAG: OmpA family protein [Muribaculaceae bacterium]|nr:OmpA family protein [Muribaculaceae bacterium]